MSWVRSCSLSSFLTCLRIPGSGGWVDFDGATVLVGSAHGDPGRFAAGQGPELPLDKSVSFGDFRCRTDSEALYCVNYAHQSAVRMAAGGVG